MPSYVDRVAVGVYADARGADRQIKKVTDKRRQTMIQAVLDARKAKAALQAISREKAEVLSEALKSAERSSSSHADASTQQLIEDITRSLKSM